MAFVTPVVEHWLEREIAQWVHHEGSIHGATSSYPEDLQSHISSGRLPIQYCK